MRMLATLPQTSLLTRFAENKCALSFLQWRLDWFLGADMTRKDTFKLAFIKVKSNRCLCSY